MSNAIRATLAFSLMAAMLLAVGYYQSWNVALTILNLCLISAVMSLGVNIQWGYAGLFNAGVMAFTALGGLAAVLVSVKPVGEAWSAGGLGMLISAVIVLIGIAAIVALRRLLAAGFLRKLCTALVVIVALLLLRTYYYDAVESIEAVNPAKTGFLGGLGLPILFSWIVGGLFAAAVAWLIGTVALGLRADYLAIATLGISEIVIAVIKNEDWLARGVKNVSGLSRPVPYEYQLQNSDWFISLVQRLKADKLEALAESERQAALQQMVIEGSSLFVKLCYSALFTVMLLLILWLCARALNSPWGRMMRAIRDNEEAASAMGKDVTRRHLQVFVLGCAVLGIAGAMLTTLDGQFTPGTYQPLRYTFLIWVMVIVGGSGNNLGAVLGGFLIWFVWIEAEPASLFVMQWLTSNLDAASAWRAHLIDSAPHLRLFLMGLVLLLVLRFSPRGILPEQVRRS
jgi:branched-chain amino acid transport system permease protein